MALAEQACYTLINIPDDGEPPTEQSLKQDFQKGSVKTRVKALKKTIQMILNGEKLPSLLMPIIQYALPMDDHTLKKLLLIYFEIVPKTQVDGKLLHEMILVCDAYRKDLQHPNEYVRGSTLRFLCKLKEPELLEPLMPAIKGCLEHRHAYVRRNAVLAIYTIYKSFDFLISEAPELMQDFLEKEQDASCKRNAFMMLIHVDQERALDYLSTCIDQVCFANPLERARFIRCIYNLLNSSSAAVRYEAAGTLVTLSSAPTAVKAAASCYIDLIVKESDNNVKLIVLDRLLGLKENPIHERVLQDLVMDIVRVLSSPDLEVRKKCLDLVLDLVSSRNVDEVVLVLKKEVTNTMNVTGQDDVGNYRQLLVRTLHSCSIKFPDVAPTIIPVLLEFLSDTNEDAAADVLVFVREAIQCYDSLKPTVLSKLLDEFHRIKSVRILRAALWILGEYCVTLPDIRHVMDEVKKSLGEIPIVDSELRKAAGEEKEGEAPISPTGTSSRTLVTDDGTYATQSAYTAATSTKKDEERPPLRGFLLDGDFFVAAALGTTLTKLALRFMSLVTDPQKQNTFCADAMLVMASVVHFGKSGLPKKAITDDDLDRLMLCIRVLCDRSDLMVEVFNEQCRDSLSAMLTARHQEKATDNLQLEDRKKSANSEEADDPIVFSQLVAKQDGGVLENQFEVSLLQAVGTAPKKAETVTAKSQLSKVHQLTGFSDPVYAEAYIHVNQFDIVLDVLVVNQTADTLQGLTLELATLGDLKLVEKPSSLTMGPHDFCNIKASVKVASTENGIIFGNIVYDVSGGQSDRNCVVLNDIHIDIMDYIVPARCTDTEFRKMWAEFEWENKVTVNTNIASMSDYLKHLLKCTNMNCLTPEKALSGDCGFMAANLYARSIFGEDALANLSIEKPADGGAHAPVTGHIRIRAKSQGMALSLGDKINLSQKVQK
ncbi:coatomer subunit beta-like isoform X2 [Corticium candelabrum]|uniref:coatomer subunit beta-like isoform X2 n=1 Tax=Corticium candelabrum TaxID=121492 RepID=UPI002E275E7D|nr:coatomer subunit beta-like isoform X2 [Corticium candelabrum]